MGTATEPGGVCVSMPATIRHGNYLSKMGLPGAYVLTAFLFPILLKDFGTQVLLVGLIIASLIGAVVTYLYRIETAGKNLEDMG